MLLETFCSVFAGTLSNSRGVRKDQLCSGCAEGDPPHAAFHDSFTEYLVIPGPVVSEQHSGEGVQYWSTFRKFSSLSHL